MKECFYLGQEAYDNDEVTLIDIPFYNISKSIYEDLIHFANVAVIHSPSKEYNVLSISDHPFIVSPHSSLLSMISEWESIFAYVFISFILSYWYIYFHCIEILFFVFSLYTDYIKIMKRHYMLIKINNI